MIETCLSTPTQDVVGSNDDARWRRSAMHHLVTMHHVVSIVAVGWDPPVEVHHVAHGGSLAHGRLVHCGRVHPRVVCERIHVV